MAAGRPRIVIVGAGGWTFPVALARDILAFPALAGGVLALYDIDAAAAELTATAVRKLIEVGGLAATVEIPADLRTALRGADFVLTVLASPIAAASGPCVTAPCRLPARRSTRCR
jgi:alpha-galactosidase